MAHLSYLESPCWRFAKTGVEVTRARRIWYRLAKWPGEAGQIALSLSLAATTTKRGRWICYVVSLWRLVVVDEALSPGPEGKLGMALWPQIVIGLLSRRGPQVIHDAAVVAAVRSSLSLRRAAHEQGTRRAGVLNLPKRERLTRYARGNNELVGILRGR